MEKLLLIGRPRGLAMWLPPLAWLFFIAIAIILLCAEFAGRVSAGRFPPTYGRSLGHRWSGPSACKPSRLEIGRPRRQAIAPYALAGARCAPSFALPECLRSDGRLRSRDRRRHPGRQA